MDTLIRDYNKNEVSGLFKTSSKFLRLFSDVIEIVKETPNDNELGMKIRKFYYDNKSKLG